MTQIDGLPHDIFSEEVDQEDIDFFGGGGEASASPEAAAPVALPEVAPQSHPDLVAKYHTFTTRLQPDTSVVYCPCSAADRSASDAFPKSRVVYADIDPRFVSALKRGRPERLEAYEADANTFDPGPVNVLILLNPVIAPDGPASHVVEGGYVLANDFHGSASALHGREDLRLVGILHDRTPDETPVLDTDQPEQYWENAATEEEFRASPDYHAVVMHLRPYSGTTDLSLELYHKTIEALKEAHPEAFEQNGRLVFNENGFKRVVPCAPLRKKGHNSDLFVFRREHSETGLAA